MDVLRTICGLSAVPRRDGPKSGSRGRWPPTSTPATATAVDVEGQGQRLAQRAWQWQAAGIGRPFDRAVPGDPSTGRRCDSRRCRVAASLPWGEPMARPTRCASIAAGSSPATRHQIPARGSRSSPVILRWDVRAWWHAAVRHASRVHAECAYAPYPRTVSSGAQAGRAGIEFLTVVESATARLQERSGGNISLVPITVVERLAQAVQAARASRSYLAQVGADAIPVPLYDARQLDAMLMAQASEPGPVLAALVERVTGHVERLVVEAASRQDRGNEEIERPVEESPSGDGSLKELAEAYGGDAKRERQAAMLTRVFALLALVSAAAAAYWAVRVANGARHVWSEALGPLLVCGAAGVAGLFLLRSAGSRDRSAREYIRLQRGLTGVDAYLSPLPEPARHLLRATMTQTLFPRLLDDDDPLRQPVWPEADTLLQSLYESRSEPDPSGAPEP